MADPSLKAQAWQLFDEIVATAPRRDETPWTLESERLEFRPDFAVLERLLGVPLLLNAASQSGVPALALDVWTAYELRRAGFDPDRVWPRASAPRVLPYDVSALVESLPRALRLQVEERVRRGHSGGTASSTATLLGKNYVKQVDVVMATWQTGPELMISTKRMDSSFGKNAANRIEESYGDAKNLSLRHPQAALGFLYSLKSSAFDTEPDIAAWLIDLLGKLAREDDAYDAVGLLVPEWAAANSDVGGDDVGGGEADESAPTELSPAVLTADDDEPGTTADLAARLASLPAVTLRHDLVPENLAPGRFLATMVTRVLDNSPINFHQQARARLPEDAARLV